VGIAMLAPIAWRTPPHKIIEQELTGLLVYNPKQLWPQLKL
jgi:hypothetical protein